MTQLRGHSHWVLLTNSPLIRRDERPSNKAFRATLRAGQVVVLRAGHGDGCSDLPLMMLGPAKRNLRNTTKTKSLTQPRQRLAEDDLEPTTLNTYETEQT